MRKFVYYEVFNKLSYSSIEMLISRRYMYLHMHVFVVSSVHFPFKSKTEFKSIVRVITHIHIPVNTRSAK